MFITQIAYIFVLTKEQNKYMKQIEIVRIKEQIQNKIEKGDYITLGKMLGTSQDTARMRFRRNNEESVLAIQSIIDNRDSLIESYKEK